MFLSRAIWLMLGVVSVYAIFSTPKLSWELASGAADRISYVVGIGVMCLAVVACWRYSNWLAVRFQRISFKLSKMRPRRWLLFCFLLGMCLRILWLSFFHTPPRSDNAIYFDLARRLSVGDVFVSAGEYAYWPPGYPLFLSLNFRLLGCNPWVPWLVNLLIFGATLPVVFHLTKMIIDTRVARLSTFLLAIWPNYIVSGGLASKEALLVLVLPLVILIYLGTAKSDIWKSIFFSSLVTGICLGFACLTQPSMLLFPGVLFFYEVLRRARMIRSMLRLAFVFVGMALVITPWTLRNHKVLGEWELISTNGGYNFYRANNELATGGYTPYGQVRLEHLNEVQRGRMGFQLGKAWALAHPLDFLKLSIRKQILFLGDDASAVFETLKRGLGIGGFRYMGFKALCNLYWLVVWVLILAGVWYHRESWLSESAELSLAILSVVYLFSLHSVFESGSRYHEPLTGLLAVLAPLIAHPAPKGHPAQEIFPSG